MVLHVALVCIVLLIITCVCVYLRTRAPRLVRDSNLERRLRHVALGEKPTIHLVEDVEA